VTGSSNVLSNHDITNGNNPMASKTPAISSASSSTPTVQACPRPCNRAERSRGTKFVIWDANGPPSRADAGCQVSMDQII